MRRIVPAALLLGAALLAGCAGREARPAAARQAVGPVGTDAEALGGTVRLLPSP